KLNQEALDLIQETLLQAKKLNDDDKSYSLLFTLHEIYASILMDPETLNLEEAEKHLLLAGQYVSLYRNQGNDILPFALYHIRLAEFKLITGQFKAARESIQHALTTLQKQPYSQQPYMVQAQAMKSVIDKILAMSS